MINSFLVIDAEYVEQHITAGTLEGEQETALCIFQLAWILYDIRGVEINRGDYFIKPYASEIYQYASINRINMRSVDEYGYYDDFVLGQLTTILNDYKPAVIAHHLQSTQKLLSDHLSNLEYKIDWIAFKTVCTRDISAKLFDLPKGQYFTLPELYEKLFNVPLKDANDAMVDAEATAECFLKLLQKFNTDNVAKTVKPVTGDTSNRKLSLTDLYFNGITRQYSNVRPNTGSNFKIDTKQTSAGQKSKTPWISILLIIIGLINIITNPESRFIIILGLIVIALGLLSFSKKQLP